jgi:molybdenum cofactor biosynthesis enzyme MoaA
MRERWLGATGRRVPELAVDGELELPEETLVLDVLDVLDPEALREAFDRGRPVAVRAGTAEAVREALARPEVSCVLVPPENRELVELDLRSLTYG